MLGEKLYLLRKNKNISQEEIAEILNTSRQAVSKWERDESKPDIDKLILIAKLFNVSIDYLLDYEIDNLNVDRFINNLELCCKNNKFDVDINDIRLYCIKYSNNFKLHYASSEYLYFSFIKNNNNDYLDLALSYISKAILLYNDEYSDFVSLNYLHKSVAQIYMMQNKYDQAKKYIKSNNVYDCNELLAKCEFALQNYDDALKLSSQIYLKSASDIINISFIQIMTLLKKEKTVDAYDFVNWSITFIKSIKKDDNFFKGILCPLIYLKATCEYLLNIDNSEAIKLLKHINDIKSDINIISSSSSIKFYFGKENELLNDSTINNIFKGVIEYTSKGDIHYLALVSIYEEVFGEKYYE